MAQPENETSVTYKDSKQLIILLDPNQTMKQLADQIIEELLVFCDKTACFDYIKGNNLQQIYFIVSGNNAEDVIDDLISLPQIHCVYIFCVDVYYYEQWAKPYNKILGVFHTDDSLIVKLAQDLAFYYVQQGNNYRSSGNDGLAGLNYRRARNIYYTLYNYVLKQDDQLKKCSVEQS
ncbi:unnamed protein product [Didymodactylos carnosus]|uniref:Uncharacterized protein n=1 Tax=Didymodactylos carnosus TaxID=1234261 RepID=A0A815CRU3_9BILA|nr:unnamed protein product [Didymodactylos carnosus]CAF1287259.1 unnamed protein product [Didymodactylos carnosus]CAF3887405.1 unnamed protein product [Didymodactylos carnosus]CAF4089624.1 unnamed protein product [Didymodactylos carnosus]